MKEMPFGHERSKEIEEGLEKLHQVTRSKDATSNKGHRNKEQRAPGITTSNKKLASFLPK